MPLLNTYHLPVAVVMTIIAAGTLAAQPDSTIHHTGLPARPQRQWLIPHVGGYVRTPLGFVMEFGVRGGIDILRNVVTVTGELGLTTTIADDSSSGGLVGLHALRLEVTPLPIGFMRRVALHVERRLFDRRHLNMRDFGFGVMYRCVDYRKENHVLFVDATFVVLKDVFVPFPFIGVGAMVWL